MPHPSEILSILLIVGFCAWFFILAMGFTLRRFPQLSDLLSRLRSRYAR